MKQYLFLILAVVGLVPVLAADTVKVGAIMPLSGSLTAYGKSTLDGVKFRVEEINRDGGIGGKQIELIVEDNKGQKADTRNAFKKLTSIDKVVAVIGPVTSGNTLGIANDVRRARVPTITPTASNDRITPRNPFMFRTIFNDSFQGRIVANYALKELGHKKAAIITELSSDYSKGLSANFKRAFLAGGGQIVAEESYQARDTEFGGNLSNIQASGAEVVFVPGYPPEVPLILKQAGVMNMDALFCGADGWDNDAVLQNAGDKIVGSFIVGAFSVEDDRPVVKDFVRGMQATGKKPGTFEALGYDSVSLLAEAMKSGTDSRRIQTNLLKIENLELVTGKATVDEHGDAVKSAVILGIAKEGGKYVKKYLATVEP